MPNGNLQDTRDCATKVCEVLKRQIVSGVNTQTDFIRFLGGVCEPLQFRTKSLLAKGTSIGFGIQFDSMSADLFGALHLVQIGIEEQADPDTSVL